MHTNVEPTPAVPIKWKLYIIHMYINMIFAKINLKFLGYQFEFHSEIIIATKSYKYILWFPSAENVDFDYFSINV